MANKNKTTKEIALAKEERKKMLLNALLIICLVGVASLLVPGVKENPIFVKWAMSVVFSTLGLHILILGMFGLPHMPKKKLDSYGFLTIIFGGIAIVFAILIGCEILPIPTKLL